MALVMEKPVEAFDLREIQLGYRLWGRHYSWPEGKAGFVTSATEDQLIVQYHPGIGNVTNHFMIPVSEAVSGQWEIRWSADMSEVFEYGIKADGEQQGTEGAEGEDEAGGTDL